jgi:hypothetical protein
LYSTDSNNKNEIETSVHGSESASASASASSDVCTSSEATIVKGKASRSKEVNPFQRVQSKKKKVKYSEESYEELDGIHPEELRQLNRMLDDAYYAASNYEELLDLKGSMSQGITDALLFKNKMETFVDMYKDYLDLKYRN